MLVWELGYFDVFLFPFLFGEVSQFVLLGRSSIFFYFWPELKTILHMYIKNVILFFSYIVKWVFF